MCPKTMDCSRKMIINCDDFLGSCAEPQFLDLYPTSSCDLGEIDHRWYSNLMSDSLDISGVEKSVENQSLSFLEGRQTEINNVTYNVAPTSENQSLDETSFCLGQMPGDRTEDLSTTVVASIHSPHELDCLNRSCHVTNRADSFKISSSAGPLTTPKRLCFSLGAELTTCLDWSVSMQTPVQACSAPSLHINNDSLSSACSDTTVHKEVHCSPSHMSEENLIDSPRNKCVNSTKSARDSTMPKTLDFLFSSQISREGGITPTQLPTERTDKVTKDYNFTDKTVQVLNIFSPCSKNNSRSANEDSGCKVSFMDYYSGSISSSVMSNICDTVQGLTTVSDDFVDGASFCFTTSTPARKVKSSYNLCRSISPLVAASKYSKYEKSASGNRGGRENQNLSEDLTNDKLSHSSLNFVCSEAESVTECLKTESSIPTCTESIASDDHGGPAKQELCKIFTNEVSSCSALKVVQGETKSSKSPSARPSELQTRDFVDSCKKQCESSINKENSSCTGTSLKRLHSLSASNEPKSKVFLRSQGNSVSHIQDNEVTPGSGLLRKRRSTVAKRFLYPTNSQITSMTTEYNSSCLQMATDGKEGDPAKPSDLATVLTVENPAKTDDMTPSQLLEVQTAHDVLKDIPWTQVDPETPKGILQGKAKVSMQTEQSVVTPIMSSRKVASKRLFDKGSSALQHKSKQSSFVPNEDGGCPEKLKQSDSNQNPDCIDFDSEQPPVGLAVFSSHDDVNADLQCDPEKDLKHSFQGMLPGLTTSSHSLQEENPVIGFKMASGKHLQVPRTSLERAKAMYLETNMQDSPSSSTGNHETGNHKIYKQQVNLESKSVIKTPKVQDRMDTSNFIRTRSGRCFSLSEKVPKPSVLLNSRAVKGSICTGGINAKDDAISKIHINLNSLAIEPVQAVPVSALKKEPRNNVSGAKDSNLSINNPHILSTDMKTSSGTSEQASCDKELNPLVNVSKPLPHLPGFKSASGKCVPMSELAQQKAQAIFSDMSDDFQNVVIPSEFNAKLPVSSKPSCKVKDDERIGNISVAISSEKSSSIRTACSSTSSSENGSQGFEICNQAEPGFSSNPNSDSEQQNRHDPNHVLDSSESHPALFPGKTISSYQTTSRSTPTDIASKAHENIEFNFSIKNNTTDLKAVGVKLSAVNKSSPTKIIFSDSSNEKNSTGHDKTLVCADKTDTLSFCDNAGESKTHSESFVGVKIASGELTEVNETASETAKACVNHNVAGKNMANSDCESGFVGFKTAGGKPASVNKTAINAARALFSDISDIGFKTDCDKTVMCSKENDFLGFKTANERIVSVCKADLESAKAMFNNSLTDKKKLEFVNEPSFSGFKTAGGNPAPVNPSALDAAKTLFNDVTNLESKTDCDKSVNISKEHVFLGFKTAGGKAAPISKASLESAKALFNDTLTDKKDIDSVCEPTFIGFKTAGDETAPVNPTALDAARTLFSDISNTEGRVDFEKHSEEKDFFGFKTAAGKSAPVSRAALKTAKALFNDTASEQEVFNAVIEPGFLGFKTAGGKLAPVNKIALDAARTLFSDISNKETTDDCDKGVVCSKENFVDFKTASGKTAPISKAALEKAKALLDDTSQDEKEVDTKCEQSSVGFETINEKSTSTNSDGLNMNKVQLGDTSVQEKKAADINVLCFKTADGKPAPISRTALESAKALFVNISEGEDGSECVVAQDSTVMPSFIQETKHSLWKDNSERPASSAKRLIDSVFYENNYTLPDLQRKPSASQLKKLSCDFEGTSFKKKKCEEEFSQPCFETQEWLDDKYLAYTELVENQEMAVHGKKHLDVDVIPGKMWKQRTDKKLKRSTIRNVVDNSCPGHFSGEQLLSLGVKQPTLGVNASNAEDFYFTKEYYSEVTKPPCTLQVGDKALLVIPPDGIAGKEEFARSFLSSPGVDPKLVDRAWIYNHYRWIVWKLASLEVAFPRTFSGSALTPDEVMFQLKYRYDKEIDNSQRSALKKIIERDETSGKTLVLCVSLMFQHTSGPGQVEDEKEDKVKIVLELTDGWYKIKASLDPALHRLVEKGKITVGQKIITSGAELVGSDTACTPLEAPESLALRISANSTRIARWDAKLGFQANPKPFPVPVSSILPDGGMIGCLRAFVYKVFPIQYLERYPDGSTVTRSSSAESRAVATFERMRSTILEKIIAKAQKTFEGKESWQGMKKQQHKVRQSLKMEDLSSVSCGQELHDLMERATDPKEFQDSLSCHQLQLLVSEQQKIHYVQQQKLQEYIRKAIEEKEISNELPKERNVTPVLKMRLLCLSQKSEGRTNTALLSIWNVSQNIQEQIVEGKAFSFFHLLPRLGRGSTTEVHLNSTKRTSYEKTELDSNLIEEIYIPRQVLSLQELRNWVPLCSANKEVETVGLVFKVQTNPHILYITDSLLNITDVHFRFSFENVCTEETLQVGQFVLVSNVQISPVFNQPLRTLHTTEFSMVLTDPRKDYQRNALSSLKQSIQDVDRLITAAIDTCGKHQGSMNNSRTASPVLGHVVCSNKTPPVRRRYPQYSPVYTSSYMSPVQTNVTDGMIIKYPCEVEPGSPAFALRHRARQKMASLDRVCLKSPVNDISSPPTTSTRKPFKVPLRKDLDNN